MRVFGLFTVFAAVTSVFAAPVPAAVGSNSVDLASRDLTSDIFDIITDLKVKVDEIKPKLGMFLLLSTNVLSADVSYRDGPGNDPARQPAGLAPKPEPVAHSTDWKHHRRRDLDRLKRSQRLFQL